MTVPKIERVCSTYHIIEVHIIDNRLAAVSQPAISTFDQDVTPYTSRFMTYAFIDQECRSRM